MAGTNYQTIPESGADAPTTATGVQFYAKVVSGLKQLFARISDGTIYQLTPITPTAVPQASSYGSGFDGALNFDGVSNVVLGDGTTLVPASGVYSLTRCIFASSIIVAVGATIRNQRWRIFCTGNLTLDGTISQFQTTAPVNGGNATGGQGGTNATGATGVFPPASGAGGQGGAAGAGAPGTVTSGSSKLLGSGVAIVAAGANGGRQQGGGGGSATTVGGTTPAYGGGYAPLTGGFDVLETAINGKGWSGTQIEATGSGGGGGGGSTVPSNSTGGGGGAPGGIILVAAKTISGTGTITARGGNGANGTFNNGGAGASGGGGGAGGTIILITSVAPTTITITVAGGTGGTGIGLSGVSGGSGGAGFLYQFLTN